MTGHELIKALQNLTPEQLNRPVFEPESGIEIVACVLATEAGIDEIWLEGISPEED